MWLCNTNGEGGSDSYFSFIYFCCEINKVENQIFTGIVLHQAVTLKISNRCVFGVPVSLTTEFRTVIWTTSEYTIYIVPKAMDDFIVNNEM
jgi:hypothetical protein